MKLLIYLFIFFFFTTEAYCQYEFATGFAVNRILAMGMPIQVGYEKKIKKNFYTKSQFSYKKMRHYNDFIDATFKARSIEFHQTVSHKVINNKKFIFQPNIGINYRFFKVVGEMHPPYNTLPIRAYRTGPYRDGSYFKITSYDTESKVVKTVNNLGFSFQLQCQFKLNNKLWLQITPFVEPDYDKQENTGGLYVGVVWNRKK